MQELVYQHGINNCFNYNIEALRDAVEVIGSHSMTNAYQSMAWAITDGGHLAVMITDCRSVESEFRAVMCEFQGDGCATIYKCDCYGKPIYDGEYTLFDTHSYIGKSSNKEFKKILKSHYDVIY